MIRMAVGAVIQKGDELLLVHKVKGAQGRIKGTWDFPKGGMEAQDKSMEAALLRELEEETGSTRYTITKQIGETIVFDFDAVTQERLGYKGQETTMFLVQYTGDGTDLEPHDDEIDDIRWVSIDCVAPLLFPEARLFFEKYVLERGIG
ncbi:NUDIX hydrolase [Paenibacillus xylanilyticus]|uniref:NUDIX hydrolase n=1 Tax=Paenibacillus xylanilyticus TaxID=248903 RepID=UPI0039A2CFCB